jgi:hypothetical protein
MNLRAWLCVHDYLRHHTPGHLRLRCQKCGWETVGLTGPLAPPVAVVVKAHARHQPKPGALRVVKTARKTA